MARARTSRSEQDVPLARYQSMRDFSRTPEPAGSPAPEPAGGRRRFVVQRHRARALHYDVRFEIDGVLVSWAVPKGPTLDPDVRRLAVHVEDHPVEYIDFEGVIPSGEYGGGDVIVWDAGTWEPAEGVDPAEELAGGTLHVDVQGQKIRGRFVLVRTKERGSRGKEQWMMLHKHDEHAVSGWDAEDHPRSVLSGRTNDEVRDDPDRLWRSDLPADRASIALRVPVPDPPGADELAALDEMGVKGTWEVFGRSLRLTNLDKVLFPAREGGEPVTKRDLVRYTAQVAPVALPYLAGRALNMHRYPNGAGTKGFWHKELPGHAPDWLPRWENPEADPGETRTYLVVDEPAALVWAANFGALEWHPWTSRTGSPHRPSYVLFDIDPGERTSWEDTLLMARLHRTALEHLGVHGRPKVTGRRGIQIWVPICEGPGFDETRAWAETVSRSVGAVVPELVSWKWNVSDRGGLARLDYTQNAINKTLVAPYSPRPAPGAPVSAPIDWDELDDPTLRPDGFTLAAMARRLAERGDLFADVQRHDQQLPAVR
ncbi:ATP-dependent DNA ligase [Auraticoccus sp. F435]|uniref:ATP-dependent DNA ligase n=1 Tax=Auraticoccus cholistanensis TaxID=2656650 RepID=A0A6A9UXF6_9ACTN|nr:DNA polymerase ligase N-terminal domain-containing protein [Auraticoccus cholistanensis]MVA76234.1 ATP-dependent DNA ligase [Auraticoccus cholistanensis]